MMLKTLLYAAALLAAVADRANADGIEPYRSLCVVNVDGQGTGTLISIDKDGRGLILTCRHVAEKVGNKCVAQFLWAGGGSSTTGVVVSVVRGADFDTDLALILVDKVPEGVPARPVAQFDPHKGPWIGAGYRDGWLRVTHPIDVAIQHPNGLIIFPTPLVGGMSGGALFDRHGNVVAVLVASDRYTMGVATDGDHLHRMITEFLSHTSVVQ